MLEADWLGVAITAARAPGVPVTNGTKDISRPDRLALSEKKLADLPGVIGTRAKGRIFLMLETAAVMRLAAGTLDGVSLNRSQEIEVLCECSAIQLGEQV